MARAARVPADEALLRGGLADEQIVYRALALELGLPFTLDLAVHGAARYPHGVLTGIAPLATAARGFVFAYAPPPGQFADILARGRLTPGLTLTTPTALRRALMAARAPLVAGRAADGLYGLDPDLSARSGLTTRQAASLVAGTAATSAAFTLGAEVAGSCASLAAFAVFLANAAIRLAALLEQAPASVASLRRRPDHALPVYTVLLPVYREARVLGRLLSAVDQLDYPKARLDAKLLVEADDAQTKAALAAFGAPRWLEIIEVPPGQPRTKPRALNVALPLARGEYLTIFDAEDVPDPGQLRLAVETFACAPPDVACLQARLVIDNTQDGWLTRLFTLEYAALFDVINPALARFDLPIPLGGTSNHVRTEVIRRLGGWDAWNVTEDADLGIRLAAAGYRVGDLASTTLEEAPRQLAAWVRQRRRWTKGFLQVAITYSRRPGRLWRMLGPARFVGAALLSVGMVASSLGYPFFLALVLVDAASGQLFAGASPLEAVKRSAAAILFVAGLAAIMLPALEGARRRGFWTLVPFVPLLPFYYLLVSWAAWRGLADLVLDPYRWLKTEHGLARTSRSGLLPTRLTARLPAKLPARLPAPWRGRVDPGKTRLKDT